MCLLAVRPTNEFNGLGLIVVSQLSPVQQYRLMMMALNGESIVNPFGEQLDWLGLTPKGRARKEREEIERFRAVMAQLEERRIEVQRELDRQEEACLEALHETDEQLRAARQRLHEVQERAYKITLPDGTTARVYRDGDRVRDEKGAEVSPDIVRAEDLGTAHSTWQEHLSAKDGVADLEARREAILAHHKRVQEAREQQSAGGLTAEEFDALKKSRPESVRAHERSAANADTREPPAQAVTDASPGKRLGQPFSEAASPAGSGQVLSEDDFEAIRRPPPGSTRAPM